jgi:hypothetical protein
MKILSIRRQAIKHFVKSELGRRPVLVFHCEFENEYSGKTDYFYLFSCIVYDHKPLLYGISKEEDCNSVWDWRNKLCYAMKEAMNNPNIKMDPFLLSNKIIHELAETVRNHMSQELEPGSQIVVVDEPKDARRVLMKK